MTHGASTPRRPGGAPEPSPHIRTSNLEVYTARVYGSQQKREGQSPDRAYQEDHTSISEPDRVLPPRGTGRFSYHAERARRRLRTEIYPGGSPLVIVRRLASPGVLQTFPGPA